MSQNAPAPNASLNDPARGRDAVSALEATPRKRRQEVVSTRRADTIALAVGVLWTVLVVGWLVWASARNIARDRALTASEVVSGS